MPRQLHKRPARATGHGKASEHSVHTRTARQTGQGHTSFADKAAHLSTRPLTSDSSPGEDDGGQRLNKFLAGTGLCSRRKADELIEAGRVTINDRPAGQGERVLPGDTVRVDGKIVQAEEEQVTLMLHKPVEVVSTARDPQGRTTVLDLLPARYRHLRLFPVGRLDYYSEGLILLTNDGALAQRLMHPSHARHKVYEVLVRGRVTEAVLDRMRGGMRLAEGEMTARAGVQAEEQERGTLLTITLQQGLNRQIRRMCRDCGLVVLRLKRIAEAGLELGNLPKGRVRELTAAELAALRSAHAGPDRRHAPHGQGDDTGHGSEYGPESGHNRARGSDRSLAQESTHRENRHQGTPGQGHDAGRPRQGPGQAERQMERRAGRQPSRYAAGQPQGQPSGRNSMPYRGRHGTPSRKLPK